MAKTLQVGIIGASAERGWAKGSHVPAVQGLAGLELAAVATTDQKSADAAAKAFGAQRAYGNVKDLLQDLAIDLVTVAVKVPDHRELILGAIAAGKHIYCEWPLGRDVAEAEELRDAAAAAGVHAAIGLQARQNPAIAKARKLIGSGTIGRVLSARMYSGTVAFARKIGEADLYLEDPANGATLLMIHGGHAVDAAIAVLGPLDDVTALASVQYSDIEVGDAGRKHRRSIPDHLMTQSSLKTSGVVSVEVAGGRSAIDSTFRLEVTGDIGRLALQGGAPRGFQSDRLRLLLNDAEQQVDEGEVAGMPDMAANVASTYAALRDDILHGTSAAPGFGHAVRLTRLIDDIMVSSRTGTRMAAADWLAQS